MIFLSQYKWWFTRLNAFRDRGKWNYINRGVQSVWVGVRVKWEYINRGVQSVWVGVRAGAWVKDRG